MSDQVRAVKGYKIFLVHHSCVGFCVTGVVRDLIVPTVKVLYNAIHSSGIAMVLEGEGGCTIWRTKRLPMYRQADTVLSVGVTNVRRVIENNNAVSIIVFFTDDEVEIRVVASLEKPYSYNSDTSFLSIKRLG